MSIVDEIGDFIHQEGMVSEGGWYVENSYEMAQNIYDTIVAPALEAAHQEGAAQMKHRAAEAIHVQRFNPGVNTRYAGYRAAEHAVRALPTSKD